MAVDEDRAGDPSMLDMLAQLLAEQDMSKEKLRRLGFGVIGTPWPQVIEAVEQSC